MSWREDSFLGFAARQAQLDEVADKLAAYGSDCNDFDIQQRVYDEVGIDSDTFTDSEIEYLQARIARKVG